MIVIIGAGLAGLAAAQKLKEAGHEDFLIFEAQDYIGGRANTQEFPEGRGANWLYGGKNNPIYEWLSAISGYKLNEFEIKLASVFATPDGKQAPYKLTNPVLKSAYESKRLFSVASKNSISKKPLVNHFQQALNRSTNHCCSENSSSYEKSIKLACKDWCELHESIENSCASFDDLSASVFTERDNEDRRKISELYPGWKSVVDKMVQSIGLDKIFISTPVDKVEYSSKSVLLTVGNGMIIECGHVILATPIGTLQKSATKSPESCSIELKLEPERQAMIDRIGFGPATKIILQSNQRFLAESVGLLWTSDPSDVGLPTWTRDLKGFDVVPGLINYLTAWVGRSGSLEVEKCSDSEIGEICHKVLKTFLPDKHIPQVYSTRTSRFSTNPYIGGSNSYPSVRSDEDSHDSLWDPICVSDRENSDCASCRATGGTIPRVLFAGEATAGQSFGTTHGAIMSGWREADRLLKFLSQPKQEADE